MALLKKNKQHDDVRGASKRRPKPSRSFNWKKLVPVFALASLLLMTVAVYQGASVLFSLPVARVIVSGEYLYIENPEIISEVESFLESGFVRLDISGIRRQLIKLPWVYDVTIIRNWPDEIVIKVTEQSPIAHWGNDALLNHRGELFKPDKKVVIDGLPWLHGPDVEAERVMNHFRELNMALAADNLKLSKLFLNERGSWSAQLNNGIEIVFGSGELMGKIKRLLFAYDQGLSTDFERIKTIDMRYNNGFSVGWQQQES